MNILTFDIEDWFNLLEHPLTDNIDNWKAFESRVDRSTKMILDLLDEHDTKGTFFVLGWVAENHPQIIKEIQKRGHEIGTHSYAHKVAYSQTRDEFSNDLIKSIRMLEDVLGKKITAYRAPGFSVTEKNMWVYEILMENGISHDSSIFPAARYHGGFNNFPAHKPFKIHHQNKEIHSFPLNIKKILNFNVVYTGGGYFRLLPKQIIKRFMEGDDYVMTYFHPRDFDYQQPVMDKLSLFRRFKSYYGLKGALQKLSSIIEDFSFMNIEEADKRINWNEAETIYLKNYI